jgi:hypothetical protein
MKLEVSRQILEKTFTYQTFIKIRPVEAELFHEDVQIEEQTDLIKLIVAFRNFANAPKNSISSLQKRY